MRLHLPSRLFRAVIALMVAVPSALYAAYTAPTEIVIPEQYSVVIQTESLLDIYSYSDSSDAVAFRLTSDFDIEYFNYWLMNYSAGSRYFTSNSASDLVAWKMTDCVQAFYSPLDSNSIEFVALRSVDFSGCYASNFDGGAIFGSTTLSNNGTVTFSENTAEDGGAIYGTTITLNHNNTVTFSGNTASGSYSKGGAVRGSVITLSNNGTVTFSGNEAFSSSHIGYGGAIYGDSDSRITLSNNGTVSFSGNLAFGNGGAIHGRSSSTITLSDNGEVSFSGNTASNGGYGGAIHGSSSSTITLSDNGEVSFSGNTAETYGGAIYGDTITLSNNDTVTFSGNTASGYAYVYGGAIHGSTITLSDNDMVTFSENTASGTYSGEGGAIYSRGNLHIRNNGSVEFAGNVEKSGSSYRLRSIYASGGEGYTVTLSAAEGKSIIFRDAMYSSSSVELNADYNGLKQKGDILFTGATTEADLLAAKGSAGTAEEILNSRTTEVLAMTNLYGGRLRVEDGAVYQGQGITVHEGSEATVRVKDATLNHKGYSLSFASGTKLEVEGSSTISGNVVLNDGAAMSVSGTAALDGGLSLKSGATAASLEGVSFRSGRVRGNGESARMQDVWMEAVGEAYGITGVAMENVHFSAALATLTLTDVSFDTDCSFSVGAEGSILLSDATLRLTLPEAGEGGIYRVDLSHLFQCTVEGDLTFDVDTEALVAAGYTGVELDFGSDADEDYSNLTLSMDGATYKGTEGNVAGFTLPTIPEPTTATLSLLALAALASRRRRG